MPSPELDRLVTINLLTHESRNRQIVFQALAHTLNTPTPIWKTLSRAHDQRNKRDYEGVGQIDKRLLDDVISAAVQLLARVRQLRPPREPR